ncbi:hypothetical protein RvY_01556 [Ramazzottius varieornatus]|uniref:RING-type domain-containing protein n=1 Tax=Ramazzottius varieornatus TaxID=947166 RepID=A0A1D1UK76_RAMVA|nr:hypothetical protein RvY_01556 [Ramazzottius varieornatus]
MEEQTETTMAPGERMDVDGGGYVPLQPEPEDDEPLTGAPFVIKKFSPVFFWSWDVHSDSCAICRVMLMEPCLNCQVNNKTSCVVVWGECNHAFHNCCMAAWIKSGSSSSGTAGTGSKCPLCQAEWIIQRVGN